MFRSCVVLKGAPQGQNTLLVWSGLRSPVSRGTRTHVVKSSFHKPTLPTHRGPPCPPIPWLGLVMSAWQLVQPTCVLLACGVILFALIPSRRLFTLLMCPCVARQRVHSPQRRKRRAAVNRSDTKSQEHMGAGWSNYYSIYLYTAFDPGSVDHCSTD